MTTVAAAPKCVAVRAGEWEPEGSVLVAPGLRALMLGELEDGVSLGEALAAYPRTGEQCFAKLRGKFAIFIWDEPGRRMWAVRDPMGTHPLFYAHAGEDIVFAPSTSDLRAYPGVRTSINRLAIADSFRNSWPSREETYFNGIERVPPGHALRIGRNSVTTTRYWMPRGEAVRWLKDDEIGEFDSIFERAVSRSVRRGRTGIFLSGGLDSVSVAAMATDIGIRERLPRLLAMSLVFPHHESNEKHVQEPVAASLGIPQILAPLETAAGEQGILGHTLEVSAALDSPVINVWLSAYLALAKRGTDAGCSTILTGTGGDEWLGITPVLAADLLAQGRIADWARLMALGWRSSRHAATPGAIYNYLWHYSARPLLRQGALGVVSGVFPSWLARRRRRRALDDMHAWLLPDPVLRRQAAERGERFDREHDASRDPSYYVEELRQSLDHPLSSFEHEEWFHAYGPLGVEVRHPFYDADLVEFLFRVPPAKLISAGRSKGLVRDTLERRFPSLGFGAQKKVEASGYFRNALQQQAPELWKRLGSLEALHGLGIVDAAKVPDPASFARGAYRDQFYLWLLMNTEAWLRPRV